MRLNLGDVRKHDALCVYLHSGDEDFCSSGVKTRTQGHILCGESDDTDPIITSYCQQNPSYASNIQLHNEQSEGKNCTGINFNMTHVVYMCRCISVHVILTDVRSGKYNDDAHNQHRLIYL